MQTIPKEGVYRLRRRTVKDACPYKKEGKVGSIIPKEGVYRLRRRTVEDVCPYKKEGAPCVTHPLQRGGLGG